MFNTLLFILEIIICFSSVVLVSKFLGKEGLIGWVVFATLVANLTCAKCITVFGIDTAVANVMFASNFLATDILCERFGKKSAFKAVVCAFVTSIGFVLAMQIAMLYSPNAFDVAQPAMATLFGFSARASIASCLLLLASNLADVWLYEKIKEKTGEKHMWLRNNVCTILCNGTENFIFTFAVFAGTGMMTLKEIIIMSIGSTILEVVCALCDTPFLYIAKGRKKEKCLN